MNPMGTIDSIYKEEYNTLICTKYESYGPCSLEKGTSRQRSGKGAIRKRFPLQQPGWEKTKLTIRYLYHENIS